MPNSPAEPLSLLAFGAHPDDIEFGCGGAIALETARGGPAHLIVTSHGEAGTNGTPDQRRAEAQEAARALGASIDFVELDGDAHLDLKSAHAITLAGHIRRLRPRLVLAPTLVENQHPDHWRLGKLVRDACRIARFGGLAELRHAPPHAIEHLMFFAITADAEPTMPPTVLVDVSDEIALLRWTSAMNAHASQQQTRNYTELQLTRARLWGLRCNSQHAIPLWANDPFVLDSLGAIGRSARRF